MGVLWTLQSSQPGLSFYSALPLAYGTSYYAISLSINIVLTILIAIRLFQYRRTILKSMSAEHAKQYLSLATVLIESATLYSVFALLFLITYAVNNPINQIALAIAQACQVRFCMSEHECHTDLIAQQISVYMIIYRLADGSAWKATTLDATLTTVQFGPNVGHRTETETAISRDIEAFPSEPPTATTKVGSTPFLTEKRSNEQLWSGIRGGESVMTLERQESAMQ